MLQAIEQIRGTATLIVPEIILLAGVCLLFLIGPFLVSDAGEAPAGLRNRWGLFSLFTLALAWFVWYRGGAVAVGGGLFRMDELVWYTRGLAISGGFLLASFTTSLLAAICGWSATRGTRWPRPTGRRDAWRPNMP